MAITFAASVSRHRISSDRARYVVENCACPLYPPPDPDSGDEDLVVFLGPDDRGVPLEVVAVELANGDCLVIHAMRLRRKYVADYARVMECQ
jgi:hypothetical protein